jgi:hypothetical protein
MENIAILKQLETTLDTYLIAKAPALPADIKSLIVKILPYFVAFGVIVSVVGLAAMLNIFRVGLPYYAGMMGYGNIGVYYYLSIGYSVLAMIIEFLALPGLFKPSRKGWHWLFIVSILGLVYGALTLNIFSIIMTFILGLYPLFQIKSYYK